MRRLIPFLILGFAALALAQDGPLTNGANLPIRTDSNGYLVAAAQTYTGPDGPRRVMANSLLRTDANGYLIVTNPTGFGSPLDAQYWVGAANASLTAEKNLGALATALVINTAGVPSAYAGVTCTNQFLRILSAVGAGTCATVSLTADVTGTLPLGNGGTGSTAFTAGSIPFSNGTILTQDNSNLFWDASNARLGIGNTSPQGTINIRNNIGRQLLFHRADAGHTASSDGTYLQMGGSNDFLIVNQEAPAQIQFNTGGLEVFRAYGDVGNVDGVLIGTTGQPATGTKVLMFGDGTVPTSLASNTAGLYADDVGGTVNMFAVNEAGDVAQITGTIRDGAPTVGGSCGTSPAIAGNNTAGKVTTGTGAPTSCTVTFSSAWVNAPSCSVSNETTENLARATSTTTTVVLTGTFVAGDVLAYQCLGY